MGDLEQMVAEDMWDMNLSPKNKKDIKEFWKTKGIDNDNQDK